MGHRIDDTGRYRLEKHLHAVFRLVLYVCTYDKRALPKKCDNNIIERIFCTDLPQRFNTSRFRIFSNVVHYDLKD